MLTARSLACSIVPDATLTGSIACHSLDASIVEKKELIGEITADKTVSAELTCDGIISGTISVPMNYEAYDGEYKVTPAIHEQTMATSQKVMKDDVTIKKIPYYDVSNQAGGSTIYIGGDVL